MLTRQQLQILNKNSLRYPLQIAEKDYVLALTLQLISESPLGEKLVLKVELPSTIAILSSIGFPRIWIFHPERNRYRLMRSRRHSRVQNFWKSRSNINQTLQSRLNVCYTPAHSSILIPSRWKLTSFRTCFYRFKYYLIELCGELNSPSGLWISERFVQRKFGL